MLKRRLYLQIYATIIGSIILVAVLSGLLWNLFGRDHFNREVFEITSELAMQTLPVASAPEAAQREAVIALGRRLRADVGLFDQDLRLIASFGRPVRSPSRFAGGSRRAGPELVLSLPDRRWLVVKLTRPGALHPLVNLVLFLGSIAVSVVLASYPLVRRLTRRLERLQKGVERIGGGELSTRVEVEGRDEVAALADSFNEAAAKIEQLVEANRLLLANASHELRTPLARIRLGIEMLEKKEDPERRKALKRDIGELDMLIDEILLMSRLEAGAGSGHAEAVDLVALIAEECARFDHCSVSGRAPDITGDPNLLRRLVRNLLKNAVDHGAPPVEAEVEAAGDIVRLTVGDCGPGIAEENRDKVFEPFYRDPARQNSDGYGLGLALVRQIAEAHGGTAAVATRARTRSGIIVTLPVNAGG
ncbi:MAG: ATP-binding protein [Rhizobiaceae bacterium]